MYKKIIARMVNVNLQSQKTCSDDEIMQEYFNMSNVERYDKWEIKGVEDFERALNRISKPSFNSYGGRRHWECDVLEVDLFFAESEEDFEDGNFEEKDTFVINHFSKDDQKDIDDMKERIIRFLSE